jgi:lipopolysaccharide/colanic/teichoic acid biosynthesis glycosyltransferase
MHADLIRQTGEDPRHPKLVNDPRVTRVGRWIRRFSIDEVPQIWNILRGEMSWVGPRPAVPQEVALYEPWHRQRLRVLPGLTGLWQVSGRSEVPFEEMCLLDIYYIENWSLGLDLQIILRTIPKVLFAQGAA